MPGFSMLSFAAVLEPLRMANRLRQAELYEWLHFSPDDGPVRPSNGIEFAPTRRLEDNLDIDTLIVVAGIRPMEFCSKAVMAWLRAMANRGVRIGATSTGPLILASAGLLTWLQEHGALGEPGRLPGAIPPHPRHSRTVRGRPRPIHLLGRHRRTRSDDASDRPASWHKAGQCRGRAMHPSQDSTGTRSAAHGAAAALQHQPSALAGSDLADGDPSGRSTAVFGYRRNGGLVAAAGRTAVRRATADRRPARFYKRMRLERATALLEQTSMSVLEVAIACGFTSSAHLSTSYRQAYGRSPRSRARVASNGLNANRS